jgi:hypothetical protein
MNEIIRNFFNKQAVLLQLVRPPALHSLVFGAFGIPSLLAILVVGCLVALWWHHPLYGKNQGGAIYPIVGNLIQILCHVRVFHDWNMETRSF